MFRFWLFAWATSFEYAFGTWLMNNYSVFSAFQLLLVAISVHAIMASNFMWKMFIYLQERKKDKH